MKKRVFIIILFFLVIFLIVLFCNFYIKKDVVEETTSESKFNIYKIHYFSDVSTLSNDVTFQNSEWDVNVYEYTDIAIYLERISEYDAESYIKNIYIDNIEIDSPKIGNAKLYYLNPIYFGDSDFTSEISDYEIESILEYSIINYENSNDDVEYTIPIFFEDCSNPITIRFVNYDILENYIIEANIKTEFNGSILKNENIAISDISSKISFDINIETESSNQIHTINLEIEIPLENEEKTIFDGYIDIENDNLSNIF